MPTAPKAHRPRHAPTTRVDRRASAAERGYDQRWTKLRAAYVAQHPLCEDCLPTITPVHEVDHVIPITGLGDPLRLLWVNLRSRCRRHHATKTSRHDVYIRAEYDRSGDTLTTIARWTGVLIRNRPL